MSDDDTLKRLQMLIALADGILAQQQETGQINEQAAVVVAVLIGRELESEEVPANTVKEAK